MIRNKKNKLISAALIAQAYGSHRAQVIWKRITKQVPLPIWNMPPRVALTAW